MEYNEEYRKMQAILGDLSFSVVLPKQFVTELHIEKGDYVKVHREGQKIVIEKA